MQHGSTAPKQAASLNGKDTDRKLSQKLDAGGEAVGARGDGGGGGSGPDGYGPGWVYTINADESMALVPVSAPSKHNSRAARGEAGVGGGAPGKSTELALRGKNSKQTTSRRKGGEKIGVEEEDVSDADRELDRLQYQKFSRDREIDRLRGEVSSVRGLLSAKDKEMSTVTREMELKDAELRSVRSVKKTKSGVDQIVQCQFLLNGDTNGVLYKLGIAGGLKAWQNPARSGMCRVICGLQGVTAMNGVREVYAHKEDVLERAVVADTFSFDDGWFILDLDPGKAC